MQYIIKSDEPQKKILNSQTARSKENPNLSHCGPSQGQPWKRTIQLDKTYLWLL